MKRFRVFSFLKADHYQIQRANFSSVKFFDDLKSPDGHVLRMRTQSTKNRTADIGINDAPYMVTEKVNGKQWICPYYQVWRTMLTNSYSPYRTYSKGCEVTPEWHYFMAFRSWVDSVCTYDIWGNRMFNKNIKVEGCKIYSPDTALFVPQHIHSILASLYSRGNYELGVTYNTIKRPSSSYVAQLKRYGRTVVIGGYASENEANLAYLEAKAAYLLEVANMLTVEYDLRPGGLQEALFRAANRRIEQAEISKARLLEEIRLAEVVKAKLASEN